MSRAGKLILAAVIAVVVLAGGAYAFVASRGSDEPEPVTLDAPAPATSTGDGAATSDGTADGTWSVQKGENSYLGYRVQEKLAFLSAPNDAVGRTSEITGTLTVAGEQVSAAEIEADLSQLRSDEDRRDNAIRQRGLESQQFPQAVFELTEPIDLGEAPTQGKQYDAEGKGRLTIHGTTKDVTIPLQARWDGATINVAGSTRIKMTDYGITPPQFGPVETIQDEATMEIKLAFTQA
jgi:polyisoprenoid-binding protein YceI